MNKALSEIIRIASMQAAYEALSPAILLIETGAPPDARLTLKIKLLLDVASGLTRIVAALLVDKTHDLLQEGKPDLEKKGYDIVRNLSPEILLFTAIFSHFTEQKSENPATDALAMMKTLGHEIPEELIPGVRE